MASTIGNLVIDNVQAGSIGKTDRTASLTQQAIDGMNAQVLPGGLGGVNSGFVAAETPYSMSSMLYGPGVTFRHKGAGYFRHIGASRSG